MKEISADVITEMSRQPSYEETETKFCKGYLQTRLQQADREKPNAPFVLVRREIATTLINLLELGDL